MVKECSHNRHTRFSISRAAESREASAKKNMASKEIGCCGHTLRVIFLILNVFFVAVGLALAAGGIYLVIVEDTYAFITDNEYTAGAPILIVCGVVTILVAIVGIIAAAGLWWPLLLIYSVVLGLAVALEIIAAIIGFAFQSQLSTYYANVFNRTLFDYRISNATDFQSDVNSFVDTVQRDFKCCGVFQPEDWLNTTYFSNEGFPDTCICSNTTSSCVMIADTLVYQQGCNGSFFDFVRHNAAAIGGIGLGFGLLEILGVVFGVILCCCVCARRNQDSWTI